MSVYKRWYSQLLTRDDIQPAELFEDKSMVITAGPGSGKTSILILKAAYVLEQMKISPKGIACLTYSRRLAKEIKNKLYMAGVLEERNVFIGTLHSFCLANIVKLYGNFHHYKVPTPLRIASEIDCQQFWTKAKIIANIPSSKTENILKFRNTVYLEDRISNKKNVYDLEQRSYVKAIMNYEHLLLTSGAWDFDLIIRASIQLLDKQSYISDLLSSRFTWLFIDEYQDLGYPLHLFTKILKDKSEIKIFAVCDPDQCIYKFQGADPKYFSEFPNSLPTIQLLNNYRSSKIICDVANVVLRRPTNQVIIQKDYPGRVYLLNCLGAFNHQCEVGKNIIKSLINNHIMPGQITVLTRYKKHDTNKNFISPGIFEIMSTLNDIPHKVLNNPFYNDHTAFVSWLQDLAAWCATGYKSGEISFYDLFNDWMNLYECDAIQESDCDRLAVQAKLLRIIQNLCDPKTILRNLFKELEVNFFPDNFFQKLERFRPDDLDQYKQIRDLVQMGEILEKTTIQEFSIKISKNDEVIINTLHGSKGSQNHIIIIIGGEQIEDPNLFYVGITRAKFATFILYTGKVNFCELISSSLNHKEELKKLIINPNQDLQLDQNFFIDWQSYTCLSKESDTSV